MEPPGRRPLVSGACRDCSGTSGPCRRPGRRRITNGGAEDRSAGAGLVSGWPDDRNWRRKAALAPASARRKSLRPTGSARHRRRRRGRSRPADAVPAGNPRPEHGRSGRRCRRPAPEWLSAGQGQLSVAGPAGARSPATARPAPQAPGRRAAGKRAVLERKRSTGSSSHTGLITPHWRSATGHRR